MPVRSRTDRLGAVVVGAGDERRQSDAACRSASRARGRARRSGGWPSRRRHRPGRSAPTRTASGDARYGASATIVKLRTVPLGSASCSGENDRPLHLAHALRRSKYSAPQVSQRLATRCGAPSARGSRPAEQALGVAVSAMCWACSRLAPTTRRAMSQRADRWRGSSSPGGAARVMAVARWSPPRIEGAKPVRQTGRTSGGGDTSVHRHAGGSRSGGTGVVDDGDQVGHLERRPGHLGEAEMHRDLVIELERLAILHERFEHRRLEASVAPLRERVADRSEVRHPSLLEVGEVVAVVDDAHCVGLHEPHPDGVIEVVVGGVSGRIDGQAHAANLQSAP